MVSIWPPRFHVPPLATSALLLLALNPMVTAPVSYTLPPFVTTRLLPAAGLLLPIVSEVSRNAPPLTVTTLPVAAPLPMTKLPALLHTALLPSKVTDWLLQPFPTM